MMYDELYKAWKLETEKTELEKLPDGFYVNIAEYIKKLREEGRMLDKKTLRTNLLKKEMHNARLMIRGLVHARCKKIVAGIARGEEIPQENLTTEEKTIYSRISPLSEAVNSFAEDIARGQAPTFKAEIGNKRAVLRFLKEVPAIIGADMKPYGPFKPEDVASLPVENTKMLIKQGLAEKVQID